MEHAPGKNPVILITGSAGLIGSRLVERLSSKYTIVGMDLKPPEGGSAAADFVECDLTSDKSVSEALDTIRQKHGHQIASVIHLAAWYDFTGEPSDMYQKLTVDGTKRLLKKLQEFETQQFIFSSSMLVLEPVDNDDEVLTEASPLDKDAWDYPHSKIKAEQAIEKHRGDISTVVLRIAGVYDEDGHSLPIAQQIDRIYSKKFDSYFFPGDASHGQPFIHLDDLSACVEKVVQLRQLVTNEMFLIAEPTLMSYGELQDSLGKLIHGKEWPAIRVPKPAAKIGAWVENKIAGEDEKFIKPWMIDIADAHYPIVIDHAREKLGWEPEHSLRETLPEIIRRLKADPKAWYKNNGLKSEPPAEDSAA